MSDRGNLWHVEMLLPEKFTLRPNETLYDEAAMSDRIEPAMSAAELEAFRSHLTWHRHASAPDCRFCAERDAKKPPPPPQPAPPRCSVRDLTVEERAALDINAVMESNSRAADELSRPARDATGGEP